MKPIESLAAAIGQKLEFHTLAELQDAVNELALVASKIMGVDPREVLVQGGNNSFSEIEMHSEVLSDGSKVLNFSVINFRRES